MFRHNLQNVRITVAVIPLTLAILLAGTSIPLFAKAKSEANYSHTVSASGFEEIDVETVNGSISIDGHDGDQINVEATIKVEGKKSEICQKILESLEIEVEPSGEVLSIEYDAKKKRGYKISVSFKIEAPSRMTTGAETVNGGISLTNMSGAADLETVNGSINCKNTNGEIDAETVNGGIKVENSSGDLDAEAVNGSISFSCDGIPPSNVDLETINGSIEADIEKMPNAEISASTMNGKIKLRGLPNVTLDKRARSFNHVMGDGSGNYSFDTINGSVEITIHAVE